MGERTRSSWPIAAILLGVLLTAAPTPSWAQAGWYVTPSLTLAEEFDDNIFGTSTDQASDFITRISLGLAAGFRSQPLTLLATAALGAEFFARHTDQSDPAGRKQFGLETQYVPIRPLTLGLNISFTETQTPTELTPETGIELGRGTATERRVSPSASYQFTPRTAGDTSYSYTRGTFAGVTTVTHEARLNLAHELTLLDTGTLGYGFREAESDGTAATRSHALTIGWLRRLARTTVLTLQAGPRVSEPGGALGAEASASLNHQFKLTTLALAYAHTETTVIGRVATAEVDTLTALIGYQPRRSLQVNLDTGVSETRLEQGRDTRVYNVRASAAYRLTRWLNVSTTYRFSFQESGSTRIPHHIFSIGLDASYPTRIE